MENQHTIIVDNATNVVKAMTDLGIKSTQCFDYNLPLCFQK